jgi:AcrR family transcriptional regulator
VDVAGRVMRSSDEPQNARGRRTRSALLKAARDIVEQDGFAALTMTDVADRASVSRRAVYLHFTGRTELLSALYRDLGHTEDLADSLQAVWNCADAVTALSEWARHIARSHPRILAVILAAERARHTDPDAALLWERAQDGWLRGSGRLMRWLASDDRLNAQWTVDRAADMMWALMSPDLLDRLLHRGWSPEQVSDCLDRLFRDTFLS